MNYTGGEIALAALPEPIRLPLWKRTCSSIKQGRKMGNLGGPLGSAWVRRIAGLLLLVFLFGVFFPGLQPVWANAPETNTAVSAEEKPGFFIRIIQNLFPFNSR